MDFWAKLTPISYYAISGSINFIVSLVIGIIVFARNPKSTTNKTFAIFSFLIAWHSFFYFLWMQAPNSFLALFYVRISMLGFYLLIPTILHFVISYLKTDYNKELLFSNYLLGFIFASLGFTSLMFKSVRPFLFFPYWPEPGLIYHFVLAHVLIQVTIIFILMFKAYKESKGLVKAQITYIIIAAVIGSISGLMNNFGVYQISIPPVFNALASVYVWVFGYAIIKHRLFDIRLLVLRSVGYLLALLVLAIGYVLIFYFALEKFDKLRLVDPTFLKLGLMFAMVFAFIPSRTIVSNYTNRIFARSFYKAEDVLKKVSDILSSNLKVEDLAKDLTLTIATQIKIDKAAFILQDGYQQAEVFDVNKQQIDKLFKIVPKEDVLLLDETEEGSPIKELLRNLKIDAIIYFKTSDNFGFIALSQKSSGEAYFIQDTKIFEAIGAQLTVTFKYFYKREETKTSSLSGREKQIFILLKQGLLYKQIAKKLDISIKTVEAHTSQIFKKLQIKNRFEL